MRNTYTLATYNKETDSVVPLEGYRMTLEDADGIADVMRKDHGIVCWAFNLEALTLDPPPFYLETN